MAINNNTAESSPFSKSVVQNEMAYYFDDDKIGIIQKQSDGSWDSIKETCPKDSGTSKDALCRIHYHGRYSEATSLNQKLSEDLGIKHGLHSALLNYVRQRLMEDQNDQQRAMYYGRLFKEQVNKFPYRRSGIRGIVPYSFK